jgi:predicted Zn-ribbon and HTH transcriptional regulator
MDEIITELPSYECKRCFHRWNPRIVSPPLCPKCKSPYWRRPPKNSVPIEEIK